MRTLVSCFVAMLLLAIGLLPASAQEEAVPSGVTTFYQIVGPQCTEDQLQRAGAYFEGEFSYPSIPTLQITSATADTEIIRSVNELMVFFRPGEMEGTCGYPYDEQTSSYVIIGFCPVGSEVTHNAVGQLGCNPPASPICTEGTLTTPGGERICLSADQVAELTAQPSVCPPGEYLWDNECYSDSDIQRGYSMVFSNLRAISGTQLCSSLQLERSTLQAQNPYNDSIRQQIQAAVPQGEEYVPSAWNAFYLLEDELEGQMLYHHIIDASFGVTESELRVDFEVASQVLDRPSVEATCLQFADGPAYYELVGVCPVGQEAIVTKDKKFGCA